MREAKRNRLRTIIEEALGKKPVDNKGDNNSSKKKPNNNKNASTTKHTTTTTTTTLPYLLIKLTKYFSIVKFFF